jgi:hypothetical protein
MNFDALNNTIANRLTADFAFKPEGDYLRGGKCPSCEKKSLWTWKDKPGQVQCNRTNNCSWSSTSKDLFPDLFEQLNKKHPATPENPTATADAYLALVRGFDPGKLQGWYEQGKYWHPHGDKGTATVRFYLDAEKTVYWERLIEDVTITEEDGSQETRKMNFKGTFKGTWWQPPGFEIAEKDEVYWCEGILDAIALTLSGKKAVAIMSAGTFPSASIEPHRYKGVKWVLALDNDKTGREKMLKHAAKLRDMKERVAAAVTSDGSSKLDWNDLFKQNKLGEDDHKHYRYLGRLELVQDKLEKGHAMWKHSKKDFFVFTHNNSTYSLKIDAKEYEKAYELLKDSGRDTLKLDQQAFETVVKIKQIATFKMEFLYFQQPVNGEDGQYFFRLNFANHAPEVQMPFHGKIFGAAGDFKKQAMHKAPGAQFTGSTPELDYLYKDWLGHVPKIVKTLDFVGYDKESKCYVFPAYAVQNGKIIELNSESFFQLKTGGIKTTVDIKQRLSTGIKTTWLDDYRVAFGKGGLVALSWWFGCLFVEQVRQSYRSYPFFEVVGEAGSGKSDMVDFLWKLLGREGETFNPNTSSLAGRTRKMAEVSCLPVVFNETDNETGDGKQHFRTFNWDEQKDLFDGEFGRVTGVKSQDNSTRKPVFKAGLMIVQNIPVQASEAIMSRIVHLQFDRSHHSYPGKLASDRLNLLAVQDVSGFLLHSLQQEAAILKRFDAQFARYRKQLASNPAIKLARIVENHAKIMAFADCLPLVLPIDNQTIADIHKSVIAMAEARQEALADDHPIVQQFWATFDYLNSKSYAQAGEYDMTVEEHCMNHSTKPEEEIAVSLEHFANQCSNHRQELIQTRELRRHLQGSRKRKFLRCEPIYSRLEKRSVRCWIFKNGG